MVAEVSEPAGGPFEPTPATEIRLRSTMAGKIVVRAGLAFLGFDLVVLGKAGFAGLFLLTVAGGSAWLARRALVGVRASVRLPGRVSLGRRFTARVRLVAAHAARDVVLETGGGDSERRVPVEAVSRLAPAEPAERGVALRLERRGHHDRFPLSISTTWPTGLFEARAEVSLPCSVLVLPRVQRIRSLAFASLTSREERRTSARRRSGEGEFRSLREFRRGDPVSRIHWRTSARHARLLLRELEDERAPRYDVVFDPRIARPDAARALALFESGVTAAASLVAGLLKRGGRVRLQTLGQSGGLDLTGPRDLRRALVLLARVEPRPAREPLGETSTDVAGRVTVRFGSGHRDGSGTARAVGLQRMASGGWIVDAEARGSRDLYAGRRRAGDSPFASVAWHEAHS